MYVKQFGGLGNDSELCRMIQNFITHYRAW